MFNRSAFNSMTFNRPSTRTPEYFASAHLVGLGGMAARTAIESAVSAILPGEGSEFFITSTRGYAQLSGCSDIHATVSRDRHVAAHMAGEGDLIAHIRKSKIKIFDYTGVVQPGDEIIIDMGKKTVTLNGQNAIKFFEGDFFDLLPGDNVIKYEDGESSRKLLFVFRHRDRWV